MLMKQNLLGPLLRWPLLMAIQVIGVIVNVLSLGAKVRLMLRQIRNSYEDRVDPEGKAIFVTGKTLVSKYYCSMTKIDVRVICFSDAPNSLSSLQSILPFYDFSITLLMLLVFPLFLVPLDCHYFLRLLFTSGMTLTLSL